MEIKNLPHSLQHSKKLSEFVIPNMQHFLVGLAVLKYLFNVIIILSAFALAAFFVALRPILQPNATQDAAACVIIGMIFYLGGLLWVTFGNLLPSLAVSVRRLHDTNKSGWWLFMAFLPLIGWIILLIWMCQDSDYRTNKYGVNARHKFPYK